MSKNVTLISSPLATEKRVMAAMPIVSKRSEQVEKAITPNAVYATKRGNAPMRYVSTEESVRLRVSDSALYSISAARVEGLLKEIGEEEEEDSQNESMAERTSAAVSIWESADSHKAPAATLGQTARQTGRQIDR